MRQYRRQYRQRVHFSCNNEGAIIHGDLMLHPMPLPAFAAPLPPAASHFPNHPHNHVKTRDLSSARSPTTTPSSAFFNPPVMRMKTRGLSSAVAYAMMSKAVRRVCLRELTKIKTCSREGGGRGQGRGQGKLQGSEAGLPPGAHKDQHLQTVQGRGGEGRRGGSRHTGVEQSGWNPTGQQKVYGRATTGSLVQGTQRSLSC